MQIALKDRVPRFYHLLLQPDLIDGWSFIREWGQQGERGRVKVEYFSHRDEAEEALIETRNAQVKRGYRIVFIEGLKES